MINIFGYYFNEIIVFIMLECIACVVGVIGWVIYNKNRFDVYLCEKYLQTYKIKKKMKAKYTDIEIKWKDKGYSIDFANAIIDVKGKPNLYYNYLDATPIMPLMGLKVRHDSATFKVAMDGNIMKHLSSRKMDKWYTYIILALVIGLVAIGGFALYQQQQSTIELANLANRMLNMTIANSNKIIIP